MADGSSPPPAMPARQPRRSVVVRFGRSAKHVRSLKVVGLPVEAYPRPRTRGECVDGPRPCPYAGCRHHLFLDVQGSGNLKLNFPELEPGDLDESCSLDVADRREHSLDEIGQIMSVTRERARQIEERALLKLAASSAGRLLREAQRDG